ncbi:MAG: toll/interleukin-1 receptor domain-containing protein [Marinifilaceae bacterium]|jgi:hypothetical protein|nr:toll/interleukin-1 receptor domain-containing protein [Marinifilaceae bacterium]
MKFQNWIQIIPITWLSNLTPEKFSISNNVSLVDAENFFLKLADLELAQATIRTKCPNCNSENYIAFEDYKVENECYECLEPYTPNYSRVEPSLIYKIKKEDFAVNRKNPSQFKRLDNLMQLKSMQNISNVVNYTDKNNPSNIKERNGEYSMSNKVFVSYSHNDKKFLDRLQVHLKPLVRNGNIDLWDDTKINTGDLWKQEIERSIEQAKVAILLISADFLASDFIVTKELPPLLVAARQRGASILPVIISPCRFEQESQLSQFQAINSPDNAVNQMSHAEQEQLWFKLSIDVERCLTKSCIS